MGIFAPSNDAERKDNLKILEDKRVAFAKEFNKTGYKPIYTLYVQYEGGFRGISKLENGFLVLFGPGPGSDEDFSFQFTPTLRAEFAEKVKRPEGMRGLLGYGKRGAYGYDMTLTLPDESTVVFDIMTGYTLYLKTGYAKDPLFKETRRRGNANIVWDFAPLDRKPLEKLRETLDKDING